MAEEKPDEGNILGCYVSITNGFSSDSEAIVVTRREQGNVFRSYIWGESGISNKLKKLQRVDYGVDLQLILFEFYVNPLKLQVDSLKPIGTFRKKERSLGIAIIVNEENFFSKSEAERQFFLWTNILERTRRLEKKKKDNRLDTDIGKLISDIESVWKQTKTSEASG